MLQQFRDTMGERREMIAKQTRLKGREEPVEYDQGQEFLCVEQKARQLLRAGTVTPVVVAAEVVMPLDWRLHVTFQEPDDSKHCDLGTFAVAHQIFPANRGPPRVWSR